MAGNAMEWVHDGFQKDLGSAAVTDPVGVPPVSEFRMVLRGGSAGHDPLWLRAAKRLALNQLTVQHNVSFRCVRSRP
jgi:formylglycine-generating enzyme required for sulfatase activity